MPKQIISMNVDKKIYSRFSRLCKEKGLVMSKQIEIYMDEFLKKNE